MFQTIPHSYNPTNTAQTTWIFLAQFLLCSALSFVNRWLVVPIGLWGVWGEWGQAVDLAAITTWWALTHNFLDSSLHVFLEMLGVAALVGITGLVYWLGYRDMDNRHKNDGRWAIAQMAPRVLTGHEGLRKAWSGKSFLSFKSLKPNSAKKKRFIFSFPASVQYCKNVVLVFCESLLVRIDCEAR